MADAATDKVYSIPTSGDGGPFVSQYISVAQAAAEGDMFRPLRSLRVLYENGYEMELDADDGPFPGEWEWLVLGPGQTYQASGSFKEDKDSEAVERAMIAASAWFSQVEWARLETDSPESEPAS
jgi:hypothetical protein